MIMPRGRPRKNMACLETNKLKTDEELKAEILKKYNEVQKGSNPITLEDQLKECVVVDNASDIPVKDDVVEEPVETDENSVNASTKSSETTADSSEKSKILDIEEPEECGGVEENNASVNDVFSASVTVEPHKTEFKKCVKLPFVDANSAVVKENEKLKSTIRSLTEEIKELKAKLDRSLNENEDIALKLSKAEFDKANYREQLNTLSIKMRNARTVQVQKNTHIQQNRKNIGKFGMNGYESWN